MFDQRSLLGVISADPDGLRLLERYAPRLTDPRVLPQLQEFRLGQLRAFPDFVPPQDFADLRVELERLPGELPHTDHDSARSRPSQRYEGAEVPIGSASIDAGQPVPLWGSIEITLRGPSHGNPFLDVEIAATFALGDREVRAGGFYDGDGTYRIRLLADEPGMWQFTTSSNARSLDGIGGVVTVTAEAQGHGPVRAEGFHFRHADGTRHVPIGTTAYAWTHQSSALQEKTVRAMAESPFNKIRMCLFPKHYAYNLGEPDLLPFERDANERIDLDRFSPIFWRNLETAIARLASLGVQADVILFHPYDRWGFAEMGAVEDDRYVTYAVRRLAGFANVWWSLANEYDLMWNHSEQDWDRIAGVVTAEDPSHHLLSIHNFREHFDHRKTWVTHASVQRTDPYVTSENTTEWRARWQKPVVIDECGYEGDLSHAWGNLTGREMVRRFWEGAVRGGYVGHGETYLNDDDELWWSKGGVLRGSSPRRIELLARVIRDSPSGVLEPLQTMDFDVPWGGAGDSYRVGYLGANQPSFHDMLLPDGDYEIDIIDTWNCSIDSMPGLYRGSVRIPLPARPFMAIRLRRAQTRD